MDIKLTFNDDHFDINKREEYIFTSEDGDIEIKGLKNLLDFVELKGNNNIIIYNNKGIEYELDLKLETILIESGYYQIIPTPMLYSILQWYSTEDLSKALHTIDTKNETIKGEM